MASIQVGSPDTARPPAVVTRDLSDARGAPLRRETGRRALGTQVKESDMG
jgi:hypothetical protein